MSASHPTIGHKAGRGHTPKAVGCLPRHRPDAYSHAAGVRLADRLTIQGLIESRASSSDGRVRSLYLTSAGQTASAAVLAARDEVIAEGLSILNKGEMKFLADIAERVLRDRLENLEHSYRICRLCCYEGCTDCPIDAELHERGQDRE